MHLATLMAREDWQDPAITGWNRLDSHPPFASWRDLAAARDQQPSASRYSLNGDWAFAMMLSSFTPSRCQRCKPRCPWGPGSHL